MTKVIICNMIILVIDTTLVKFMGETRWGKTMPRHRKQSHQTVVAER